MIGSMLRLYLVMALVTVLSIVGIDRSFVVLFEKQWAAANEAEYATALVMLRNYLGNTPERQQAGLATLERYSPGQYVAQAPGQVAALPDEQRRELADNGFVYLRHSDDYGYDRYFRLDNGAVVAVRARGRDLYWMKVCGFLLAFLLLLAGVLFWSVPHWRDLGKLGQAAARFGGGALDTRAKLSRYTTVKPLSAHFNNMAERIEQLIRTQRDMANAASHELRTPLSRLEFGLANLRDTVAESAPDSPALARIDALGGDVEELGALVTELLTFGMLDQAGSPARFEPVEVASFLTAAVPPTDALARRGASLRWDIDESVKRVMAEPQGLRRAFSNLLQNALRYTASSILVRIEAGQPGFWRLVVEDDGPGIPPQERSRVFEPFYRLDRSRDRATGGFGLGLAIVRRVAERHGGQVWAEASELGGARFVVQLAVGGGQAVAK
ncbi:MAG TPA: ATP-binding protein [Janthinobacterium sp.]|nr:ATP-binding protein [Janthinobacterium sp.]